MDLNTQSFSKNQKLSRVKNTLLSLIARIMEPDSGTIVSSGKISSILELGLGFHPDLSGRENIYMAIPAYEHAKAVLDLCESKKVQGFLSASSVTDIFYLVHRKLHSTDLTYAGTYKNARGLADYFEANVRIITTHHSLPA